MITGLAHGAGAAVALLERHGFPDCAATPAGPSNEVLLLTAPADDVQRLRDSAATAELFQCLRSLGFRFIALDLAPTESV